MLKHTARGFTLVELMVVVAIIGVLGMVAIPAYNNYTTKSKFTEVVLATAPTKSYLDGCYQTGDCVVNGQLSPGSASSSGGGGIPGSALGNTTDAWMGWLNGSIQANQQYNFMNAFGSAQTENDNNVQNEAAMWVGSGGPGVGQTTGATAAGYVCLLQNADTTCDDWINNYAQQNNVTVAAAITALLPQGVLITAQQFESGYSDWTGTPLTSSDPSPSPIPCVGALPCSPQTKYVQSASADSNGVITATAVSSSGLSGETYVLIPQASGGRLDWITSGTCKTRAGGALC